MRLNLCSGNRKKDGFINVDIQPECNPDVVCELDKDVWPFKDNSIEYVSIIHGMEHLGQTKEEFFHFMKELYRVCQNETNIHIVVPHPRSDGYIGDPTHVRPITPGMLSLFSKKEARESRDKGFPNTPLAEYINVDFEVLTQEASLYPEWDRRYRSKEITLAELHAAVDSYYNVVTEFSIVMKAVK